MTELRGTKTEQNLKDAFAGESQARNKYTYFASVAKKEGFEKIAATFLETADNEKEHAKLHFQALSGIGDTVANLKAARDGEHYETTEMYPTMAAQAKEDGLDEIARIFEGIAKVEAVHRDRYQTMLDAVEAGTVFKKETKVKWRCRNCGFVYEAEQAVKLCPVCKHPQAHFEIVAEAF
jgi:rubrerythrin